jgi:hypothetical protein
MGSSQSSDIKNIQSNNPIDVNHVPTSTKSTNDVYPTPMGDEYDAIDKIASELPNIIDDESRQQVEDYKQACDDGKGPMVSMKILPWHLH